MNGILEPDRCLNRGSHQCGNNYSEIAEVRKRAKKIRCQKEINTTSEIDFRRRRFAIRQSEADEIVPREPIRDANTIRCELQLQAGLRMRTMVRWHENGTKQAVRLATESIRRSC